MIDSEMVQLVWSKGIVDPAFNPDEVRKDAAGAWIRRDKYNDRSSAFGWEIDHIVPRSILQKKGFSNDGMNIIDNLRPMNWRNNVSKGDDYPSYNVAVVAKGNTNITTTGVKIVNSDVQSRLKSLFSI